MPINGSLETFSLPELFQIIESGGKTGRLSFKPGLKKADVSLRKKWKLWFKKGHFIGITNPLKDQSLIDKIIEHNWVETKSLVRAKYSCPDKKDLGSYLQKESILTSSQIDLLFKIQLDETIELFNAEFGSFKFEDLNNISKTVSDGETFPWKEMTGRQKKATELSLEAMRSFSNWSRFAEDLPLAECGLQRLVDGHNLKLNFVESHLWNMADLSISLKKIAHNQAIDLEVIQQTALSMIFAGLVEEVPIQNTAFKVKSSTKFRQKEVLAGNTNFGTKARNKSQVSHSLIENLVGFLRNNF